MADPGKAEVLIRNAVLIAGPTASGKSAMALALARSEGGVIVNADSMQVYDGLRILTARPPEADLEAVPHLLYGHISPSTPYSVAAWIRDVEALVRNGSFADRKPVFVGGTGLYFRALCEGLADVPPIPDALRSRLRERLQREGAPRMHAELARVDPAAASVLEPEDGQRVVRALEVIEATGRSLLEWQAVGGRALVDHATARRFVLAPDRATLVERIDARFDRMIAEGALAEVAALERLGLDPSLPATKAIGVAQLRQALSGELTLEQAAARAKAASRQYAKRQATWFRHQLGNDWQRLDPQV